MKKLALALAVVCLMPALVAADECDYCDTQLGDSLGDCQFFRDDWLNQCEQEYFNATDECQFALEACLDECNGDPECESSCYATFDQCNQFAAGENSSCVENGESDYQLCVSDAAYNHEECLMACNPVSVEGATWGSLKARYK